jgi:hypothetical protein
MLLKSELVRRDRKLNMKKECGCRRKQHATDSTALVLASVDAKNAL